MDPLVQPTPDLRTTTWAVEDSISRDDRKWRQRQNGLNRSYKDARYRIATPRPPHSAVENEEVLSSRIRSSYSILTAVSAKSKFLLAVQLLMRKQVLQNVA